MRASHAVALAAALVALPAAAGWVTITDDGLTAGATAIRSGCVAPGQYERPPTPLARRVVIDGLPDSGRCYFHLNAGPQDEWIVDFTTLVGGRALPGPVRNLAITWAPTPPLPPVLTISGITPTRYRIGTLAVGQLAHIDRVYTWTDVGALAGAESVLTANDDKTSATAAVSFTIDRPATVYVAYDARYAGPAWLSTWTNTGQFIRLTDTVEPRRRLHRRDFPPGPVVLGTNGQTTSNSNMYTVHVVAQ